MSRGCGLACRHASSIGKVTEQVGAGIREWIRKRVPNAGLSGKVQNDVGTLCCDKCAECLVVSYVQLIEGELPVLCEGTDTAPLQIDRVIGGEVVDADKPRGALTTV